MMTETCNVVAFPYLELYNDPEVDGKFIHDTIDFGRKLEQHGYQVKYAVAPVGIYKGITFLCENMRYTNLFEDWGFHMNTKKEDYLYLLYQVTPERVRFARLKLKEIEDMENA